MSIITFIFNTSHFWPLIVKSAPLKSSFVLLTNKKRGCPHTRQPYNGVKAYTIYPPGCLRGINFIKLIFKTSNLFPVNPVGAVVPAPGPLHIPAHPVVRLPDG